MPDLPMAWCKSCRECGTVVCGRVTGRDNPFLNDVDIPDEFCPVCQSWAWDHTLERLWEMGLDLTYRLEDGDGC